MWWPPRACCIVAHSLTVILKRDFADLRQKFGTKSYKIVAMSGTRELAIKSSSFLSTRLAVHSLLDKVLGFTPL